MQTQTASEFDVAKIRAEFPMLTQTVNGKPLVYFDNAATSHKPQCVLDKLDHYYAAHNSNVHRGVHYFSQLATREYEGAREIVRRFINAASEKEVIYTSGTTESINLVAASYGRKFIKEGDEIIISAMEHHANIVPWQMLCEQTGAVLRVIPINDDGELLLEEYEKLLSPKTKFVSVVYVSNALGTINPVKRIIELAHAQDVPVLIDGAQSAPHLQVDVRELDCDFYVFSSHKICGPTGIGVLYGKQHLLEQMPPYQGGGDMIATVTFEKTTYNVLPYKFEAGTPHIAGAIGMGRAIQYLQSIGLDNIAAYEAELLDYATEVIGAIPGVRLIGTAKHKASVLSFVINDIHPHDIGTILDQEGIAVRAGHHCAQPVMQRFNVPSTARASFAFYNTKEEIDALAHAIHTVIEVFG
ncbi:MAG TPA: cysteine desulfurase [Blastocatellia bacterium]|nr:cysteine desulfurase [Blastocatellia bacterium]